MRCPTSSPRDQQRSTLGGRPFRIGHRFVRDVQEEMLAPAIAALRRALLVMHSPRDAMVSGRQGRAASSWPPKHPKSFVTLDDADHLISRRRMRTMPPM